MNSESQNELILATQTEDTLSDLIEVNNFLMDAKSMNHLMKMAKFYASSQIVPQSYQNNPSNCFVALEIAARQNISPIVVMQNLYIVKGKPSWSGQSCISMINNCNRFSGSLDFVYTGEKNTPSYGCFAQIRRKSDGKLITGTEITLQMAKNEGWMSNPKWTSMPEQMLAYRSAAFFARLYCPEVLMGMQTTDEIIDTPSSESQKSKIVFNLEGM